MGEFIDDIPYYKRIADSLRADILRAPLELQLLWLFELFMIMTFVRNKDKAVFIKKFMKKDKSSGKLVACYQLNTDQCFQGFDYKYARLFKILMHYRNEFAHHGYAQAVVHFYDLLDMRELLDELCTEQIKATLNWDNRLF